MNDIKEYKVTGIRYALGGENDSWEKMTELAEELVKPIKKGTRVDLKHEPGNPSDGNAVGVFMEWKGDYRRIGYINGVQSPEVRRLLGESGIGEGEVTEGDGHVTFFITLVGAPNVGEGIQTVEQHTLPPYPLVDTILLRTPEREESLQVMIKKIKDQGKPTVENVREIIRLLKRFVEFVGKSLCYEDSVWLDNMERLSGKLSGEHKSLGLTEQERDEVGQLQRRIVDITSDFTGNREMFLVRVMERELDEYRKLAEGKKGFFEKYDTYYLKGSLEKADVNLVRQELERLKCWLESTPWAELHNYKEKKAFAEELKYERFSRRELHEIYAVVLLIERLEARVAICATDVNAATNCKPKEAEGDPLTTSVSEERNTGHDRQPQLDSQKLANLAKYVPLPERVEDIARQLQTVKCAQDFKQVVRQIYEMGTQYERATITTKPFREALMLFVTDWQPKDNAVYRQCYEIYHE